MKYIIAQDGFDYRKSYDTLAEAEAAFPQVTKGCWGYVAIYSYTLEEYNAKMAQIVAWGSTPY